MILSWSNLIPDEKIPSQGRKRAKNPKIIHFKTIRHIIKVVTDKVLLLMWFINWGHVYGCIWHRKDDSLHSQCIMGSRDTVGGCDNPLWRQLCMHCDGKCAKTNTKEMPYGHQILFNLQMSWTWFVAPQTIWYLNKHGRPAHESTQSGLFLLASHFFLVHVPPMYSPVYHKIVGTYTDQSVAIECFVPDSFTTPSCVLQPHGFTLCFLKIMRVILGLLSYYGMVSTIHHASGILDCGGVLV